MENILNKVIEIEDYNGNIIMALEIDEKGNIKQMADCSIADKDFDYIFNTNKNLIRIQADN
ncbi:MAG: hypothetical protein ACI4VQ_05540 [Clostridia bacterium]